MLGILKYTLLRVSLCVRRISSFWNWNWVCVWMWSLSSWDDVMHS